MAKLLKRIVASTGAAVLATSLLVTPSFGAPITPELQIDTSDQTFETLRSNMPQGDRVKFDRLSGAQQQELLIAALDPESTFNAGTGKWKNVKETDSSGAVAAVAQPADLNFGQMAATKRKTDSHKKSWKMFGITYASVEARMTYQYNGKTVTSINSCGGFYTNLIPLRTIQSIPSQYFESKKTKAVCEITWHVTKSGGIQEGKAVQGLRVSGKGVRIGYWDYDA
ncbi:hypothetical protein ACT3UD_00265 [Glutamicibacter sp. 287]|uniref:hypothetical protein n=1 Tax=unclassified Glutamicibacter TaxID=2627139 RepID=UPI0011431563|nr:hypothetical protein [Glutamicibacter sp. BW80]